MFGKEIIGAVFLGSRDINLNPLTWDALNQKASLYLFLLNQMRILIG